MSALKVTTETTSVASSKVVPFHQFGHEEQVKNTDQGNVAVSSERKRKHPLPASNMVSVPAMQTPFEKQLAVLEQTFNALSQTQKEAFAAKVQTSSMALLEHVSNLAKVLNGGGLQDPPPSFNAWNQSILMAYTNFAENQMNQNGLIMNGWATQQEAQNATLQETADAEKNSTQLTNSKSASVCVGAVIGWSILAAVLVVVAGVLIASGVGAAGVGFAATLAAPVFTLGVTVTGTMLVGAAAIVTGVGVGLGCYYGGTAAANNFNNGVTTNPDGSPGSLFGGDGVVELDKSPSQAVLSYVSRLSQFWNTISQTANNNIQSGSQTNLVSASSNDTQLGQQASQAIQAMGQTMQTPLR